LINISDAYTAAEVNYTWKKKPAGKNGLDGVEIVSQEMSQFDLKGVRTETKKLPSSSELYNTAL